MSNACTGIGWRDNRLKPELRTRLPGVTGRLKPELQTRLAGATTG